MVVVIAVVVVVVSAAAAVVVVVVVVSAVVVVVVVVVTVAGVLVFPVRLPLATSSHIDLRIPLLNETCKPHATSHTSNAQPAVHKKKDSCLTRK
jgi:hypothetical protein